jgi:hypothetical protein
MKRNAVVARYPLLGLAMLALLAGLCGGLLRLGWGGGHVPASFALAHGPLMVCGFLGTLVGLERAVALRRGWAYAVPLVTGLGGVLAMGGMDGGPLLSAGGSLGLVGLYAVLLRAQAAPFLQVMALGAGAWLVGNAAWLSGAAVPAAVPWWIGFLVLTIAGERLELSRVLSHAPPVERWLLAAVGLLVAALGVTTFVPEAGTRLLGGALVAMAAWLARYDVARRMVRQAGLTRFIAVCLLAGYGWLGAGGVLALAWGDVVAGPVYDAVLHAVFVGFVFSMIFGHAPIIFPAVLGVPPFYRPAFYAPLALLHASLLLRIAGDLAGPYALRRWGSLLNAAAILLFLASVGLAVLAARRAAPLASG